MVKALLESILHKERAINLEEHPTKVNGYSTRDFLAFVGPREDLRVPRVRKGEFYPYRRRTSLGTLRVHPCSVCRPQE